MPPSNDRSRLLSLRRQFLWLLIGVVGLFAGGMALSLVFGLRSNEAAEIRLLNLEATQARASVLRGWDHYQELAGNLAHDPQVTALMRSGSVERMQQWAQMRQRMLPNLLGLALISPQGEVYGDASLLHVGPGCQRDLREHPDSSGPVRIHRDTPGMAHIDLTADVRGADGALLGRVFLSVTLAQFQRIITDSVQPGHVMALLDASGEPVVSAGSPQAATHEITLELPAMGWKLVVQSTVDWISRSGWLQSVGAGMITLACVLLLLVVVVMRVRRPILQDILAARDALACLTRGESAPPIVTRYLEFAPATVDINRIAQQLHDQREQLARLSLTDPLTGLPNRRAFETHYPQAQGLAERHHPVALVMLDIDHFKQVNDRFGHGVGDQVLLALAQSLKALTRRADLAARLAGDEFAVLLTDLDVAGVRAWYARLTDHFAGELNAFGLDLQTSLSAGQTWLGSSGRDTKNSALMRADRALYQAKTRGRGQLAFAADEDDAG
ncbi:MAG: diguanylate cyclase [Thiobacillus sp.]|jgi:diguanylate cyclase (GGDEF)-like protein|uniref:GGDEF domain-containing protein n=1 Tax=Thiobacillus sp. TaxID=924 RepID=UPI0028955DD8|nr:diguanylate cyclase [Thiobacillus sp.]MDT3705466.1 diguanylate cyclase [Thiobacillus sp.]